MNTRETQLSGLMKAVFWFVVINSVGGALSLIMFSTQTERYFFWNITPPINAMLVGTMYLVAGLAVAYAAIRGTWESTRFIAAMGFSLSVVLLIATLLHIDRFVPGIKLTYWLAVYLIFPVLVALMYWRYERSGTNWQVIGQAVQPLTRVVALAIGAEMLVFALVGFFFPSLIASVWPWTISPLMVRVFLSWLTALAVSNLWFWVEKDWDRVQPVAYMLIATPIVIVVMMIINRSDVTGSQNGLWGFIAALVALGMAGVFMLWRQREKPP